MSKHRTRDPMPVGVAVFFIAVGLILGSVFTFGMQYWGQSIAREDAVVVSADFASYRVSYGKNFHVSEIILRFDDYDQLCIDSACVSEQVLDEIEALDQGARVEMLVHPNSNTVWELKHGDKMILTFEESQKDIKGENIGFGILGVFAYFCAVIGFASLLMRWGRARRRKRK